MDIVRISDSTGSSGRRWHHYDTMHFNIGRSFGARGPQRRLAARRCWRRLRVAAPITTCYMRRSGGHVLPGSRQWGIV